ncbi:MAG: PKD domain-containing protein, partial [Bacteroidales bacterium]|nr:PKD domain-containing protein [Bacteroidales bacterium]
MNGSGDYYPDMAKGRISVTSATQAMSVIDKIIDYEKTPPTLSSFYTNAVNCAYFQESSTTGYAERRFAQTSEDIRDYTNGVLGYNVSRIYATGSSVNPTNWNNGTYSAGEAIPSYLDKPGFAWDGDYNDINNTINSGVFYVFHRDHGDVSLWGDPYYTITYMNSLSNGNLTPVVFSINCLTGKFLEPECFSEKFLRYNNGGAVGVFCHAEVSYSGYNDGLAEGLVDAIWSNPGLIPNFTGSGGIPSPTLIPHSDIFTMGDVANQGLLRMVETWGDHEYTHQLFHYFGDPAMKIWTEQPTQITATHQTTINCNDNTFTINSCSLSDGLATLVIDGLLVGEVQLTGGTGTINIPVQLYGNYAWLTISEHNYQPYVAQIPITGDCINSSFTFTPSGSCLGGDDIVFTDNSSGPITSYNWDFGTDATPATANTVGPHIVSYASAGWKYITLTVYSATDTATFIDSLYIDAVCSYNMPSSGSQTLTGCSGILYDNGGQGNYTANIDATTVISTGADHIDLNFTFFDIEAGSGSTCDYDWIEIYDGPNTGSPLIGRYCNTTGSPGSLTTSGGDVTILQHSDPGVELGGFEMLWQCVYANQPPVANFSASDTNSCSSTIDFTDLSTNAPTAWTWYFGDGTTSTQQNPSHTYSASGTFDVKLVCSNAYGTDSLVKTNYITINLPSAPIAIDATRCSPGQLIVGANGSGTINWYDSPTSTTILDTGNTYTTPFISNSTIFYAEDVISGPSVYGGNLESNINGAIYTAAYEHGIYFDCFNDITLVSVEVNASTAGNRTIALQNSSGTVIDQRTINIPAGISRINLNFDIPAGTHYKLVGPVSPNLYRNNAGCNYPYAVGSDISITESDASSSTSYYYYFYNWEITTGECISGRTAVNANIIIPNNITLSTSGNTSICDGDSVTISAPAGATSYLWYPTSETSQSINATAAGNYYVMYSIDSCLEYSDTVNISILDYYPIANFSYTSSALTVTFNNQSQYGNTYFWDFGDGNTSTDTNTTYTYPADGTYIVTLIVNNTCGSDTITQTITVTSVGIQSNNLSEITLYPNPANSDIMIESNQVVITNFKIYDIYERLVMENKTNNSIIRINIQDLAKGVYFIKLKTNNSTIIKKFVKS